MRVKIFRHSTRMSIKQIEDDINDFIKDVDPVSITQHTTEHSGKPDLVFTTVLYDENNAQTPNDAKN